MAPPTVPRNADELAEIFADADKSKAILGSKESLTSFIDSYAKGQQGEGSDLSRQIETEVQKELANYLRENDQKADKDAIKRLNLDPQNGPANRANMLTTHRQATAYNAKAPGAKLDNQFANASDYIHNIWHLNESPTAREKRAEIRNAFSSGSPSDGGFLVPETLRSQLLEIALEMAVVRARATVVPMETSRVPFPMIDSSSNQSSVFGGMVGYWGEEGADLVDSSAKFARAVLDAKKLTGLSVVPNELLSDSLISFAALIERLWPMALAFYEDAAFMAGTGAGEPLGFLGAGNKAAVAVAKETSQTAFTVNLANIVKMYSRMLPSSLSRAVWICSPDVIPQLFMLAQDVGTGGSPMWLQNVTGSASMTILGRPLIVTEKAKQLGSRGDIAFVDLSYYLVGDRQTMTAASSTDWKFGSDQTAFRIIQRVDGRPWLKSPITPQNGGATLSPFVELAARTA